MHNLTESAPLVVLVHGWPVTSTHWRFLSPALRAAGCGPLELTLPGLGAPAGEVTDFSKGSLARWVLQRVDEHLLGSAASTNSGTVPCGDRPARMALVGHDWGGTVAALAAGLAPHRVAGIVIEEEVLPGVDVSISEPGSSHYPQWHGPFNAAPGVAEGLVPGREDAYFGAFLRQSAGPTGLDSTVLRHYVEAYSAAGILEASLAYYRTGGVDRADVSRLTLAPLSVPLMTLGGRYGFGSAVFEGARRFATDVTHVECAASGHYPLEQEPEAAVPRVVEFLLGLGGFSPTD